MVRELCIAVDEDVTVFTAEEMCHLVKILFNPFSTISRSQRLACSLSWMIAACQFIQNNFIHYFSEITYMFNSFTP